MLQLLNDREVGLDPPWLLPRVYGSQRFVDIELSSRREFVKGHKNGVTSMDIDRQSGRYILSGGSDTTGTILLHDTLCPPGSTHQYPIVSNTFSPISNSEQNTSYAICSIQWYPHDTGMFVTSSADRTVKVWDTNEMCPVESFKFTKPVYTHVMAAAQSHCLIAVGGKECEITLCDIHSGSSTHILRSHNLPVMSLAWSPHNDFTLASGSQDNRVLLWDIRKAAGPLMSLDMHNGSGSSNSASVETAHSGHVNGLCFSSDGLYLLSFATDNKLKLWDAFYGKNTLINYGHLTNYDTHTSVQFAVSSHTSTLHPVVCLPSSGSILLIEMLTGKKIKSLQGHFGTVNCVMTHPFEQELFSGGGDGNILTWEPPPPKVTETRSASGRGLSVYQDDWSSDEER
ncbi:DNA excision repair protein ERCC-8-like [Halichondria panicea]|uniref:DNA excision repair protein ERCC-8-like n=1 Tax=Halichondria panicea TaxID=6063 RepID=UPI00312B67E4